MGTDTTHADVYLPGALLARLARPIEDLTETVECTMVFADVSGFTRLSERLARRGKEGAEQLVDIINACFSALLAEADRRGGSLVKFGGDAMLLMFHDQEGDQEHAARACSAATAMRRRLRAVGRIRAANTNIVLRISVGVHSGPYGMFVVGGSHRELLIGGPAASTVVAMEGAAGSGQILISPETARHLPHSCVGAAVGPGALLARSPAPREWVPPVGLPTPPPEVVASFLPVAIRAHLLSGPTVPEHRTATIAFLQFRGLDQALAAEGPEGAARRLDDVVRLVQEVCERDEVSFLDSDIAADGAKIRLSAGAPRVVGDDEERMLLALREIVDADTPLPVHVGVNRGPVFSGEVGPAHRRWYVVMGDTVNLAARVMGKAPAGHIYATSDVLRQLRGRFRQTEVGPFTVKGKAKPVQAWDVGPPERSAAHQAIRTQLPLVGRERELGQLASAIAGARRGAGNAIELVGETGTGKSRLLAEARKLGEGMRVLRSTCEVVTRDTPYFTWRELLRQLLGIAWDDPEERVRERLEAEVRGSQADLMPWLPLIAIVVDVPAPSTTDVEQLAPDARASKLHEVVLGFLTRALVVPTIVEVEHAHLMDGASVALFEALTRELESSSWVVLVTRRDDAGGLALADNTYPRIELTGLCPEDAQALALLTAEASQVPPHVLELAVERSGGSPEFLLDLLAAAAAGDREELPESVGAATMARIDALEPRDGAIVRRAAVLGINFHPRRLAVVLPADMELPEEGFWDRLSGVFTREPDGHVRFRRPAIQEVAYASLPFKLRRELHMAVGLRLERDAGQELDAGPAILSNHFSLAGDYSRAHRYAMAAAKLATERFSHADAGRLYRRAIEAGRADGVEVNMRSLAEAWEQLGDALRHVGEPAAAVRALSEARKLVGEDPIGQARLFQLHAEVAERTFALTAAVRWLRRGFRSLDEVQGDEATKWRARMRSKLAGVRAGQGRWKDAISDCRVAIAEAESVGELSALAHACYVLDWALVESGRPAEATYSWRALDIYEQLGDPAHKAITLNNLGMFAYWEGRWDDAIDLYRNAGECGERAGRPADAAYRDCNVGEILSDQGHLDEAEASLRQARRVWSGTGEQQSVVFADVLLGRLAVRRGDYGEGVSMLEAAMAELLRLGIDPYAEYAGTLIAEAEAFGGDPVRALELARQALPASDRERPLLMRVEGIALARLGQRAVALRELGQALETARSRNADYDIGATIDMIDRIGGADPDLLLERDQILERLRIQRLPIPDLATVN